MKTKVKVILESGNHFTAEINESLPRAKKYFLGREWNSEERPSGFPSKAVKVVQVS